MMMWPVTSLLARLWHPKCANERQLPTNTVGRRARLDDGSGAFLPVAVACNERPVRVEIAKLESPRVPTAAAKTIVPNETKMGTAAPPLVYIICDRTDRE